MSSLYGKVAIVTGASRGIGAAIAKEMAANGARIVINYYRSVEKAQMLAEELSSLKTDYIVVEGDVSNPEQAGNLAKSAIDTFGKIDILVNNAGITRDKMLKRMTHECWEKVINVNLNGVFYCCSAVINHMIENGGGNIINISSLIAQTGAFGQCNYAASKAGIIGFTRSAALELARHNITMNAICPGYVETDMFSEVPEEVKDCIKSKIPLGRLGQPQEIARAVKYLITDGQYITGQCLNVNGGIYM